MTDSELMQLSEKIGRALKARGATVTTAESCTGGWIAKAITDIAGSSAWFERGFVTYSNEAKSQMIGVSEATLRDNGAVSEPVVVEMAIGALRAARADYAISVSGVAGPDGGSVEKPVGTHATRLLSPRSLAPPLSFSTSTFMPPPRSSSSRISFSRRAMPLRPPCSRWPPSPSPSSPGRSAPRCLATSAIASAARSPSWPRC